MPTPQIPALSLQLTETKRRALALVRQEGTLSRAAIAARLGLTKPAVTEIVRDLKEARLLLDDSVGGNARGQPQKNLRLNVRAAYSLGIFIQKDGVSIGVADFGGTIVALAAGGAPAADPVTACREIAELVRTTLARHSLEMSSLLGAGVAVTGMFVEDRSVIWTPVEMEAWRRFPIRDALAALLPIPIIVENDGSAGAVGERMSGAGRDLRTFFYLYLAYGVGGGFVHEGRLYRGAFGNAAEAGLLIPHHPHVRPTLTSLAKILGREPGTISPAEVQAMHDSGDEKFAAFLDAAVASLQIPLAAIAALLNPQAILIGGQFPEAVIRHLIERLRIQNPFTGDVPALPQPRILAARFVGGDAALTGAVSLPLHYFFSPDDEVKGPKA